MNKKDFRFLRIDESRIEQQIVMPYKFLAFFSFFFFWCLSIAQLCFCVHAHVILYMSVLEARISAIMRIGNFNIY